MFYSVLLSDFVQPLQCRLQEEKKKPALMVAVMVSALILADISEEARTFEMRYLQIMGKVTKINK